MVCEMLGRRWGGSGGIIYRWGERKKDRVLSEIRGHGVRGVAEMGTRGRVTSRMGRQRRAMSASALSVFMWPGENWPLIYLLGDFIVSGSWEDGAGRKRRIFYAININYQRADGAIKSQAFPLEQEDQGSKSGRGIGDDDNVTKERCNVSGQLGKIRSRW
uniref:Uncharacterized protein LOC114914618 n=1 Tax=Elaeis guineensis var. tenera TaxID=51953 RepID=A0A8N4F1Z8_ELAGV|nr:uncharacterized protein LOC114914618 [Elaeis guineensis]